MKKYIIIFFTLLMVFLLSGCGDTAPDGGSSPITPICIRALVLNSSSNTGLNVLINDVSATNDAATAPSISSGLVVKINSTTLTYNSSNKSYVGTVSGNYSGGASFNLNIAGVTPALQNGKTYTLNINSTITAPTTNTSNIGPTGLWSKSISSQTVTCTPGNGQAIQYKIRVSGYTGATEYGPVGSPTHLRIPIYGSTISSYTYSNTNTWDYTPPGAADNVKIQVTIQTFNIENFTNYSFVNSAQSGTNQGVAIRYDSVFMVIEPNPPSTLVRDTI